MWYLQAKLRVSLADRHDALQQLAELKLEVRVCTLIVGAKCGLDDGYHDQLHSRPTLNLRCLTFHASAGYLDLYQYLCPYTLHPKLF